MSLSWRWNSKSFRHFDLRSGHVGEIGRSYVLSAWWWDIILIVWNRNKLAKEVDHMNNSLKEGLDNLIDVDTE